MGARFWMLANLLPLAVVPAGPASGQSSGRPEGSGAAPGSNHATAGLCPGSGDCCTAHGGLGCNSTTCCEVVCTLQDLCCLVGWSADCVSLARDQCGNLCGAGRCPGSGDCCAFRGTPGGCQDTACCETVCAARPDCCDVIWDNTCVALAENACGTLCSPCPGAEGCCLTHDEPGCNDPDCCEVVCGEDPYCCTGAWDSICAEEANALCLPLYAGTCPSEGDCCSSHAGAGCRDAPCCEQVCAELPACCQGDWDATCSAQAAALCTGECGGVCPAAGDCCSLHHNPGCNDRACCEAVCAKGEYCCFLPWGVDCASIARDLCPGLCVAPPVCPGTGDCCTGHGGPGCESEARCARVCELDASCCSSGWSSACADLARQQCGLQCWCALFGDLDGDGARSLRDVAAVQRCFSGEGGGPAVPPCYCADLSADGDVDLLDVRAILFSLSGP